MSFADLFAALYRWMGGILMAINAIGLTIGGLMMYLGWQHNSQGEFHDGETIYWSYWFGIGLSWWLFIAGIPSLFLTVLWTVFHFRSRRG